MKEKLTRLAKGIPDRQAPVIHLTPERLECSVVRGQKAAVTFDAESEDGSFVRGFVFCDEPAVRPEPRSFSGRKTRITVTVRPGMLRSGTVLSGSLTVLTGSGEFEVPYLFSVEEALEESLHEMELPTEGASEEQKPEEPAPEEKNVEDAGIPQDPAELSELAAQLIRRQADDDRAFRVYGAAIEQGLPLNRLYECYAAAFPYGCSRPMPKQVILYFSYNRNPERNLRDRLYANVLRFYADDPVFQDFAPAIREHAYTSALEGRINRELALLYDRILLPDSLDRRMAQTLPALLLTCELTVSSKRAAFVRLRCPGLGDSRVFSLRDGKCFAPVLTEDCVLTALDSAHCALPDAAVEKTKLLDRGDLLSRCYELCPDHPLLGFLHAVKLCREGIRTEEEQELVISTIRNPAVSGPFREQLIRKACAFGGDTLWLTKLPSGIREAETFEAVLLALTNAGKAAEAYLLLRSCGLVTEDLSVLSRIAGDLIASDRIPYEQSEPDRFFLSLCSLLFGRGAAGENVLGFLAANYEGPTLRMEQLLSCLREAGMPFGDLPERLLAAKLFSGIPEGLDPLFLLYIRECSYKDLIVRAYFTVRLSDYFLRESGDLPADVFAALYSYVHTAGDPSSLPRLYLIALTKYDSEKEKLMPEEQALCQEITDILIREGLVFAYMKKLRRKISLPDEILDRYYIEYHGDTGSSPRLLCRIGPEGEPYRETELTRIFETVYTAKLLLFLGDELHYIIYDGPGEGRPVQEGVLNVRKLHASGMDRYSCINRMVRSLSTGDIKKLEEDMLDYALRDEMRKELFTIEEQTDVIIDRDRPVR